MSNKKRKILERIDALERLARQSIGNDRRGHRGSGPRRDHDHHDRDPHDECGDPNGHCQFDEKRVIDTVARLVTERVGRIIQKEAQKRDGGRDRDDRGRHEHRHNDRRGDGGGDRDHDRRDHGRRGDGPGGDGGGEKRMVDLLVGLISEHVREIVVTELDCRLSPPRDDSEGELAESRPAARESKPAESE